MSGLIELLGDAPAEREAIFGVIVGVVSQVDGDPLQLNRVLVNFPTLNVGSAWARVASFAAGANRGAFFLPMAGDEALVVFEQGDTSKPYVIGMLWNGQDKPPVPDGKALTDVILKTASGAFIEFNDADGGTSITITDKNANSIQIDTTSNAINITSKQNITLSAPKGSITLSAGSVSIEASTGSLSMSATGEATLSADGEVSVSGAVIKLN
jgi:uncharacterized protein involved in type VI secretion and phage assembly